MERAEHPIAMDVKLAIVRLSKTAERLVVAGPGGSDELLFDRVGGSNGGLCHVPESKGPPFARDGRTRLSMGTLRTTWRLRCHPGEAS